MKRSILGIGLLCIFLLASTASAQTNRHDLTLPDLPVDSALPDGLLLAIESSTISPIAKLTASDGAVYDAFGISVAISGDTAIVGAQGDDDNGTDSGSAYIFIKNAGVWSQAAKLTASDGAVDDFFGYSVAISGDTAIVGAWLDDDNATDSGSAYVFVKPVSGWADMTQTAKLTASDRRFRRLLRLQCGHQQRYRHCRGMERLRLRLHLRQQCGHLVPNCQADRLRRSFCR